MYEPIKVAGLKKLEDLFGVEKISIVRYTDEEIVRVLDCEHPSYFVFRELPGTFGNTINTSYHEQEVGSERVLERRGVGFSGGSPPTLDIVILPYLDRQFEEDKRLLDGKVESDGRSILRFYDALRKAFPEQKIFIKNPEAAGLIEAESVISNMRK